MSTIEENQTDNLYTEGTSLIDIFYKDNERIYSLISQINRGAWQERIITQEKKQKSDVTHKANIGATRALGSEFSETEGEDITRNIQTKTEPFDDIVLNLLKTLNISPKITPPSKVFSHIDILKGSIRLQNFKMISNILPILKQSPKIFLEELQKLDMLLLQIQEIRQKKKRTPEENQRLSALENERNRLQKIGKEKQNILETISSMSKIFPTGIGFELFMDDEFVFSGQLKPNNLIDSEEIVFANYGGTLPAEWNILGIIDYIENDTILEEDNANPIKAVSQISEAIKGTFSNNNITGIIIPILIYRELEVYDK